MKRKVNCLSCSHLQHKVYHAHRDISPTGHGALIPKFDGYYCTERLMYVRLLVRHCPYYHYIYQKGLVGGKTTNMKIDNIPSEKGRIELNELPQTVDLKAVRENTVEASIGKSGGLIIVFQLRDGREFPQKYTKVSGAALTEAMKKLKLTDTEQLQKDWYTYRLTIMRIGLPRMIPQKKAKEQS